MKRYKIWLVLLLSFAIGCGSSQQTDGEQKAENLMQTEAQKQEELSEQEEMSKQEETSKQEESEEQKETTEQKKTEKLVFTSDYLGNIDEMVLAKDGRVYALGWQSLYTTSMKQNGKGWTVIKQSMQRLYQFDANGRFICVGDMAFSYGDAMALVWAEKCLYMVVPQINEIPTLYQVTNLNNVKNLAVDSWIMKELYRFETFSEINNLVLLGDRLYVHGVLKTEGTVIGYMDVNAPETGVTLLDMDDTPQNMMKLDEDTLGIYLAGEDETCFWKYIPAQEQWEKTDIAADESAVYGEFIAYENGCFYAKNGNVVCYQAVNGTEQELFECDGAIECLGTEGTFLYYYSDEWQTREIRRIRISELLEQ